MQFLARFLQALQPPQPAPATVVLLLALIVVAAIFDLRYRRIPNWLTVSGAAAGLALNTFMYWGGAPDGGPGWLFSLKGLGLAFATYVALYSIRAVGAGDVKLMAAVGAIVAWKNWVIIALFSFIVGAVLALVVIVVTGRFKKTMFNVGFIVSEMMHLRPAYLRNEELDVRSGKGLRFPHALWIGMGSIIFVLLSAR